MEREALRTQSPAERVAPFMGRGRWWIAVIQLLFVAMAFRFGVLQYSGSIPQRRMRSCRSVDAVSIPDH